METRFTVGAAVLLAASGCMGDIDVGDGNGTGDPGEASLVLTAPRSGDTLVRDDRGALGALVAATDLSADAGGPIVRVGFELGDGTALGDALAGDANMMAELTALGPNTLVAIGYDADGAELLRTSVDVTVTDPEVADCYGWLDLYGLEYELGPNNQGVSDPVTVKVPINGLAYRSGNGPRSTFFMDCTLAHSLAKAAPMLRARDVIEVSDYGVYNYRCINNNGTPPDCPNGISQHAYAKGIDIAGFTTSTGDYYSVNDDWVIDPDSEDTCDAPTEGGADEFLHRAICELKHAYVWNIVLTPNYNDAHRNHFHVDLTEGSDFIEFGDSVDTGPDHH